MDVDPKEGSKPLSSCMISADNYARVISSLVENSVFMASTDKRCGGGCVL